MKASYNVVITFQNLRIFRLEILIDVKSLRLHQIEEEMNVSHGQGGSSTLKLINWNKTFEHHMKKG
jgi:hypothetical protein